MTRSVVHSGHEPGPRAIRSVLCGYRAASVITVGYTGLSRGRSSPACFAKAFHEMLMILGATPWGALGWIELDARLGLRRFKGRTCFFDMLKLAKGSS